MSYLINATQVQGSLRKILLNQIPPFSAEHDTTVSAAFIAWGMSQLKSHLVRTEADVCIPQLRGRLTVSYPIDRRGRKTRRIETLRSYKVNDKVEPCYVWTDHLPTDRTPYRFYVTARQNLFSYFETLQRKQGGLTYLYLPKLYRLNQELSNIWDYWRFEYKQDLHKQFVTATFATVQASEKAWHARFARMQRNQLQRRIGHSWDGTPGNRVLVAGNDTYKIWHLTDANAFHAEGADMGHCVSAFTSSMLAGKFFVFHVSTPESKDGLTVSYESRTLDWNGITAQAVVNGKYVLHRNQALGRYNRRPTDQETTLLQDVDLHVSRYLRDKGVDSIVGVTWDAKYRAKLSLRFRSQVYRLGTPTQTRPVFYNTIFLREVDERIRDDFNVKSTNRN